MSPSRGQKKNLGMQISIWVLGPLELEAACQDWRQCAAAGGYMLRLRSWESRAMSWGFWEWELGSWEPCSRTGGWELGVAPWSWELWDNISGPDMAAVALMPEPRGLAWYQSALGPTCQVSPCILALEPHLGCNPAYSPRASSWSCTQCTQSKLAHGTEASVWGSSHRPTPHAGLICCVVVVEGSPWL